MSHWFAASGSRNIKRNQDVKNESLQGILAKAESLLTLGYTGLPSAMLIKVSRDAHQPRT